MERIGCELGGVELAGAEAAKLGRDLTGTHARRFEDRPAAHERHRGATRGERGAAALALEAGVEHGVALDGE